MRIIKSFLTIILFVISFTAFSQTQDRNTNKENLIRAAYASYYLEEVQESNFIFESPRGEAVASLILKLYRDLLPFSEIPTEGINVNDNAKVEKLISKLNQLRETPPTWQEILNMEQKHLIDWDKAIRLKSRYKSVE